MLYRLIESMCAKMSITTHYNTLGVFAYKYEMKAVYLYSKFIKSSYQKGYFELTRSLPQFVSLKHWLI